jgi:peptidoglycan lytic transglycosylase G
MEEETPMARRAERHREARDHPRKTSLFILFVAFLAVLGAVVGVSRYYRGCQLPVEGKGKVSFAVPEGATADSVVSDLAGAGLIRCGGFVGNLMIRGTGKATSLLAGKYTLRQGMTLNEIVAVLSTPPPKVPTVDILIPPGYRLTQIADAVQKALGIKPERFLAVAQSGRFSLAPYLPTGTKTVEGFVFPDTYRFRKHGTTSKDVIETGLNQFGAKVKDLPWANAKKLGVSQYQIVVIASMIEREAKIDGDRAKIAAVIYNRLKRGMTLGIDATVGYIDPDPSNGLTSSDLAIDSPYNTRLNPGLPPTPIASPGLASLTAALSPDQVPYLYYVACGTDGGHRFSTSYQRFLSDKAACLG